LYDLLDSQGGLEALNGHRLNLLQELNLDVSTEELLSAERAFTYTDLLAILRRLGEENTVLWLTPYAYVVRDNERVDSWVHQLDGSYRFCFSADDKDIFVLARFHEHLVEICDVVVRLLAASVVRSVDIFNRRHYDGRFIHTPSSAYLMGQCHSGLKLFKIESSRNGRRPLPRAWRLFEARSRDLTEKMQTYERGNK
jgi:hypothetical protein